MYTHIYIYFSHNPKWMEFTTNAAYHAGLHYTMHHIQCTRTTCLYLSYPSIWDASINLFIEKKNNNVKHMYVIWKCFWNDREIQAKKCQFMYWSINKLCARALYINYQHVAFPFIEFEVTFNARDCREIDNWNDIFIAHMTWNIN